MPNIGALVREKARQTSIPSSLDVLKAKQFVLTSLADGEPHRWVDMLSAFLSAEDVDQGKVPTDFLLDEATKDAVDAVVTPGHPIIRRVRLELALAEGLAELVGAGIAVPLFGPEGGTPIRGEWNARCTIPDSGSSTDATWWVAAPAITAPSFRIAYRYHDHQFWGLDPHLFTADLTSLPLDERTLRCIGEALSAMKAGLYFAGLSMLGAAVEGAWYAVGELLRGQDSKLDAALDDDKRPRTAEVQERVAARLQQLGARKTVLTVLTDHAELLRAIRNYGIHPRPGADAHLDNLFSEQDAGLLLLTTHRRLRQLVDAASDAGLINGE